jgi:hypothetical protein
VEIIEGRSETRPFTAVALADANWIKPATAVGAAPIEFLLYTTERDRGDRVIRRVQRQEPTPQVGERYLLFLTPALGDPARLEGGPYWLVRNSEGAFLIRDGIVVPAGQSDLSKRLAGMSSADLVARLRALIPAN